MLQELRVENLALIDRLRLEFSGNGKGLVVFTGETGAGKSIILQAIGLLTGGRAMSSWVRADCDQAVIEALFELRDTGPELRALLHEHSLEEASEYIIRRVISQKGRSRVYVNDVLVTTKLVEKLTENFINIAGQHDQRLLLNPRRHLDFIDTFGELWGAREEYGVLYARWRELATRLEELRERERDKEQRRDLLAFQVAEIREADLDVDEEENLIRERDKLKASGELASLAGKSHGMLRDGVVDKLFELRKNMERAAALDPGATELAGRIASACYEVEDIEGAVREYFDSIPMDQSRLEEMNDRLALIKQLQRKYGVTIEEVLAHAERAEQELESLDNLDQLIDGLERELEELTGRLRGKADELSRERGLAADELSGAMRRELSSLSFPKALFEVSLVDIGAEREGREFSSTGKDHVEFLFTANPGEPLKPLAQIASGGELSRLMLAMKCILARRDRVETVIFDEIDSGIGGKAAEAVANKIDELSTHHQVLCITHLPQIAAHGDEHFLVMKKVTDGRTKTTIEYLDKDERVMEIARMLGGESLTEQTIAYAAELVERSEN